MSHPTLPLADPLFLELQSALAGTYSIERELGRGGMGVVYLAREVKLARAVALKVLPPHLAQDPEHREGFLREAQMAARLSHPNIVPIHRVDEAGDFVYFAILRLRVGSIQVESVTSNPSAARELSEHVSRVVAAGDEIENALRTPHNLPASLSPT